VSISRISISLKHLSPSYPPNIYSLRPTLDIVWQARALGFYPLTFGFDQTRLIVFNIWRSSSHWFPSWPPWKYILSPCTAVVWLLRQAGFGPKVSGSERQTRLSRSRTYRSFSAFFPFHPPKTYRKLPTLSQEWAALQLGGSF